jgi:hypothetical protein
VDSRLALLRGRRVAPLTKDDLPQVAKAIVAYYRGQCKTVGRGIFAGMEIVEFLGDGLDVVVLASDWDKIMPRVQDNSFNPLMYPSAPQDGRLHPERELDLSIIDVGDRPQYMKVLSVLETLFPEPYPTSNL